MRSSLLAQWLSALIGVPLALAVKANGGTDNQVLAALAVLALVAAVAHQRAKSPPRTQRARAQAARKPTEQQVSSKRAGA